MEREVAPSSFSLLNTSVVHPDAQHHNGRYHSPDASTVTFLSLYKFRCKTTPERQWKRLLSADFMSVGAPLECQWRRPILVSGRRGR